LSTVVDLNTYRKTRVPKFPQKLVTKFSHPETLEEEHINRILHDGSFTGQVSGKYHATLPGDTIQYGYYVVTLMYKTALLEGKITTNYYTNIYGNELPTVADVLNDLITDSTMFEEYMEEDKYDINFSRTNITKYCKQQALKLKTLVGIDMYNTLLST
jgi:hypothetical protein